MIGYHNHVSDALLLQMTRALAKFVREHNGIQLPYLDRLLMLMEDGQFDKAYQEFRKAHFGAYGFDDWQVPVVFDHEDPDDVQAVFESLAERWRRIMIAAFEASK